MQNIASVIIPVYNNIEYLSKCLQSLEQSVFSDFEIIVIDDASTEQIMPRIGDDIKYYRCDTQSGPAAARNLGVKNSNGEVLIFLDSDIVVEPDTISKIIDRFEENPDLAAIFGSYDSEPECKDFLSQYKNLLHHFVHQNSSSDARTFWAGCGAIRRSAFEDAGGFDAEKYNRPSVEDIDLGYRLRAKGYKIYLDKDLQVKHLKSWKFADWIRVEITKRAIPWSKLIIETDNLHSDLNLKISDRVSAFLVWLIIIMITLAPIAAFTKVINFGLWIFPALLLTFLLYVFLNFRFYKFLFEKRGFIFLLKSILVHSLYYIYSSLAFMLVWLKSRL